MLVTLNKLIKRSKNQGYGSSHSSVFSDSGHVQKGGSNPLHPLGIHVLSLQNRSCHYGQNTHNTALQSLCNFKVTKLHHCVIVFCFVFNFPTTCNRASSIFFNKFINFSNPQTPFQYSNSYFKRNLGI